MLSDVTFAALEVGLDSVSIGFWCEKLCLRVAVLGPLTGFFSFNFSLVHLLFLLFRLALVHLLIWRA